MSWYSGLFKMDAWPMLCPQSLLKNNKGGSSVCVARRIGAQNPRPKLDASLVLAEALQLQLGQELFLIPHFLGARVLRLAERAAIFF